MPDHDPDKTATRSVDEPPPPGPADHGGHGGMATRENAPELATDDESQD